MFAVYKGGISIITKTADLSITVESAAFLMPLGKSPDFGHCAGTTKTGRPCARIVNM